MLRIACLGLGYLFGALLPADAHRFGGLIAPPSILQSTQYTRVELADVKEYASTSTVNVVRTSGQVVGIKRQPNYQLVLGDGKANYLLVTVGRGLNEVFAPFFSNIAFGDTVEVLGPAGKIQGILISSSDGATIELGGVDLSNAPFYGVIGLTDIKNIKKLE
jgi:hypothetical protein